TSNFPTPSPPYFDSPLESRAAFLSRNPGGSENLQPSDFSSHKPFLYIQRVLDNHRLLRTQSRYESLPLVKGK
ncbi:hypothetical protein HOY82DRAFT_483184, partial [Tuber indicum]